MAENINDDSDGSDLDGVEAPSDGSSSSDEDGPLDPLDEAQRDWFDRVHGDSDDYGQGFDGFRPDWSEGDFVHRPPPAYKWNGGATFQQPEGFTALL